LLDHSEHLLHNLHASVASLRLLFTFAPECRSASLRNRCSPSPEYPQQFYKQYPEADLYWIFSRPGYNSSRTEALLDVTHWCGELCGTGHLYFLAKQNGKWKVQNRLMLWIS
jgi:hypothetical protein